MTESVKSSTPSVKNWRPVDTKSFQWHGSNRTIKIDPSSNQEGINSLNKKIEIEKAKLIGTPHYKNTFNNNLSFIHYRDALINSQQLENYRKDNSDTLRTNNDKESKFFESMPDELSENSYITNSDKTPFPKNPSSQMHFTDNFISEFEQGSAVNHQEKLNPDNLGSNFSLSEMNSKNDSLSSQSYRIPYTTLSSLDENNLTTSGKFTESELTQLRGFIKECKNIQTLDKEQQTALLDHGKNLLDNLKNKGVSADNQEIILQTQKGITSIDNALTLSQKGKFRLSHLLLASTALGSCIASLMTLIINLIKNNSISDNTSDQTEALEANTQALEETKQTTENTQKELKELVEKVGNKTDEEIKNEAEATSLVESLEQGKFVVPKNDDGTLGKPQPSQEAKEIAEKAADTALQEHHDNKNKLEELKNNYHNQITKLDELQEQHEALLIKQSQHRTAQENSGKTAIDVLSGIGIVGITGALGAGSVNFFNQAKKLSRKFIANKTIAGVTSNLEKKLTQQNSNLNEDNNSKNKSNQSNTRFSPPPSYHTTELDNNHKENKFNRSEIDSLLSSNTLETSLTNSESIKKTERTFKGSETDSLLSSRTLETSLTSSESIKKPERSRG